MKRALSALAACVFFSLVSPDSISASTISRSFTLEPSRVHFRDSGPGRVQVSVDGLPTLGYIDNPALAYRAVDEDRGGSASPSRRRLRRASVPRCFAAFPARSMLSPSPASLPGSKARRDTPIRDRRPNAATRFCEPGRIGELPAPASTTPSSKRTIIVCEIAASAATSSPAQRPRGCWNDAMRPYHKEVSWRWRTKSTKSDQDDILSIFGFAVLENGA